MNTNRILLTGASGFVGQHVLRRLSGLGHPITVVTRNKESSIFDKNIKIDRFIETKDLFKEDFEWWRNALVDIDTVIHLAWYAEPGLYLQSHLNFDCLAGTLVMARAATDLQIRRFVGIGTCFEYDLSYGYLSTSTPLKPSSVYSAAKISTFMTLSEWFKDHQESFLWCRLFYMYGEGEDHRRLVPYIRQRLKANQPVELTSGKQIRDYLDVKEAAVRIIEATFSEKYGPINICSSIPITVRELAERIADEFEKHDLLQFGMRLENQVDPSVIVGVIDKSKKS